MKKITPLKAIKLHCLECNGQSKKEVQECNNPIGSEFQCYLHAFRTGHAKKPMRFKLKYIRMYCQWCMNNKIVKDCASPECNLYAYKFGHKPKV